MGIKKNVPKVGNVDNFYILSGGFYISTFLKAKYNRLNTSK
jgi:hypothetical protein